ncbi:TPA: restriction endonuclease subunit S [Streptococcus suis]
MSEVKLGDIGKISMCKRILKSQTNEVSGIPFYKISTFGGIADVFIDEAIFHEYKEKYSYPKKGDILISAAGTVGKTVIYTGEDAYFQDSNIVWIDNNEKIVTNQYLYYFYQTNPFVSTNGSTIKRLYNDNIRETKIKNVPSIEAQNKVTKVLEYLDQKIAINNQINEELEAMAKTLYDYWFVQFDFPDENGKPYKSSGGKMVYNDQLKREIPEGWGVKLLGEICNIVMGQSPSGTSYNEIGEGIVFYQGSTDFGWRYPNVRQFTTAPTRYANENDILLSVRAPVGTLNIANETCCIGRGLAAINSKSGYNSFLFQQMQLYKKEFQLRDATGTTFGSITKDDLFSLSMVIASENLMKRYENIVGKSYDKIKILSKQNKELTQLRDWLLPMLMNGQVKVEE